MITDTNWNDTVEAFANPRVGDHFQEMFSFHVFALYVGEDGGPVVVMEANPPCMLPDDGKIRIFDTVDEYRRRYAYNSIPGYWVRLSGRDKDLHGWLEHHYEIEGAA